MRNGNITNNEIIKKEEIRKEILEKLKLYHQTSKEKWEKIQEVGSILSEKELLKRGLINKDELLVVDNEITNTGEIQRGLGRDDFVFASTSPVGFGDVTLEIDLSALQIPDAKVSIAGDWVYHDFDDIDYLKKSEIPAKEFISYLIDFLPTLPNKEWFLDTKNNEKDIKLFLGEAMMDKAYKNDKTKFRTFWKLHPEILFPKELPLKYIKQIIINNTDNVDNN